MAPIRRRVTAYVLTQDPERPSAGPGIAALDGGRPVLMGATHDVAPSPLPAALPLLGAGLGALG